MSARVYRIWVPDLSATAAGLHLLAVGILGSWVAVYTLAMFLFLPFSGGMDDTPGWMYRVSVGAGVLGSVAFVRYWARRGYERAMYGRETRERRLSRLATHAEFATRFPHRQLEHALTRPNRREQRVKAWLHNAAPGTVVVVNGPRLKHGVRPTAMELGFEPIRLDGKSPNVRELVQQSLPRVDMENGQTPAWMDFDEVYGAGSDPSVPPWTAEFGLTVAGLGLSSQGVIKKEYGLSWIGLFMVACGAAVFFRRRRYDAWLVPGGVAVRYRAWGWRPSSFCVLTPADTPLVIHASQDLALLRDAQGVRRFPVALAIGLLLAAVWRSGVEPPTAKMVRSLLESR